MTFLKPIVLVGMMGVGKTTVGKRLAEKVGMPFYDSDQVIETQEQKRVSDIFALEGEPVFRRMERDTIRSLIEGEVCVIATGGGALTSSETLGLVKEKTHSIWLDADMDDVLKRLQDDQSRPLLQQENRSQVLRSLLNERQSLYAQADIHVEIQSHYTEHDVVELVLEALKPYDA